MDKLKHLVPNEWILVTQLGNDFKRRYPNQSAKIMVQEAGFKSLGAALISLGCEEKKEYSGTISAFRLKSSSAQTPQPTQQHKKQFNKKYTTPKNSNKTKNCTTFSRTGFCDYGDNCFFAHDPQKLLSHNKNNKDDWFHPRNIIKADPVAFFPDDQCQTLKSKFEHIFNEANNEWIHKIFIAQEYQKTFHTSAIKDCKAAGFQGLHHVLTELIGTDEYPYFDSSGRRISSSSAYRWTSSSSGGSIDNSSGSNEKKKMNNNTSFSSSSSSSSSTTNTPTKSPKKTYQDTMNKNGGKMAAQKMTTTNKTTTTMKMKKDTNLFCQNLTRLLDTKEWTLITQLGNDYKKMYGHNAKDVSVEAGYHSMTSVLMELVGCEEKKNHSGNISAFRLLQKQTDIKSNKVDITKALKGKPAPNIVKPSQFNAKKSMHPKGNSFQKSWNANANAKALRSNLVGLLDMKKWTLVTQLGNDYVKRFGENAKLNSQECGYRTLRHALLELVGAVEQINFSAKVSAFKLVPLRKEKAGKGMKGMKGMKDEKEKRGKGRSAEISSSEDEEENMMVAWATKGKKKHYN